MLFRRLFLPLLALIAAVTGVVGWFAASRMRHSRIEVVENDPGVLALRDAFKVPADDARLAVELGDGAAWLRERAGRYDLLLVDAYDVDGIPPQMMPVPESTRTPRTMRLVTVPPVRLASSTSVSSSPVSVTQTQESGSFSSSCIPPWIRIGVMGAGVGSIGA